jgi:hypothetical protein
MNDQYLAEQLGETMHRRVDALHDSPLDLVGVRGRARTIRRRRQGAVAAGIAAVVAAVVVPLGLLTPTDERGQDPQPVETPERIPDPVPLDPSAAPEGGAAEVPYTEIDARRLITPGATYDLPAAYPQIVPFFEAWIALATDRPGATGTRVVILDKDYAELDGTEQTTSIAVRDDGERVAWGQDDGDGWSVVNAPTADEASTTTRVTDDGPHAPTRAVGFLPDDQVVVASTDERTGRDTFRVVALDGTITVFDGFSHLNSASPASGLVAGQTQYFDDDGSSCSGAMDPLAAAPTLVWETCDHQLGLFSPDGKYVVGLANSSYSPGPASVAILDAATGRPIVDFVGTADSVWVGQVVWEDSTTLLATVTQGGEQYVVRATIDGQLERVAGPIATSGLSFEFWFPTYPFG